MKNNYKLNYNFKNFFFKLIVFLFLIILIFISGCSNDEKYDEPFSSKNILSSSNNTVILLFHGSTCPHCKESIEFFNSIKNNYNDLDIRSAEVWQIKSNANLFQQLAKKYGQKANAVPGIFIGEHYFIGFNEEISKKIIKAIEECKEIKCDNPLLKLKSN